MIGTRISAEPDVRVGDWAMAWNAKSEARRLGPGIPKSDFWASAKEGIDQVGCVYTAQGFEFDYFMDERTRDFFLGRTEGSRDRLRKIAESRTAYETNGGNEGREPFSTGRSVSRMNVRGRSWALVGRRQVVSL